jgi:Fe-S cluster assembly ATP-binding protein
MKKQNPLLEIKDLHVSVEDGIKILNGINLTIHPGEIHVIMGPNGSGKSTLANVLSGRPGYNIDSGEIIFKGQNIINQDPEIRARNGMFLAFQYPMELPGVRTWQFLKASVDAVRLHNKLPELKIKEFDKLLEEKKAIVEMDSELLKRSVNEGFSGGEKKRNEILQLCLLNPIFAMLDETDSGLDIDALQIVAKGVKDFHSNINSVMLVTHYQRILNHLSPNYIHVLIDGKIVKSGDKSLSLELESKGYEWIRETISKKS